MLLRKNSYVNPASILYKSIADRYRPVSYPDGPITARYRFIKNADWEYSSFGVMQYEFISHIFSIISHFLAQKCEKWLWYLTEVSVGHNVRKRTFCHVILTKTQISLRIYAVWSECLLSAWRNFVSLTIQNAPITKTYNFTPLNPTFI